MVRGRARRDAARIEPVELGFGLIDTARLFVRQTRKDPQPHHVAFVGDSTLMAAKGMRRPRVQGLTGRVRLALEKYGERLRLKTYCMPGLGPTGMYYAVQTIIEAKPERVVLLACVRRDDRRRRARALPRGEDRGGGVPRTVHVQYVRSLGMSLQRVPRRADDSAGGRT